MADDYSSDRNTTGSLTAEGSASGTLEQAGDKDWFRISLAANTYYTFKLGGAAQTSAYYSNFALSLAPPVSGTLASPLYSKASETELTGTFKTGAAGDYYLVAYNWYGAANVAYALSASAGTADAVGDTVATAATMGLGNKASGVFEGPVDVDMYKVSLTAGTLYQISSAVVGTGISSGQLGVSLTDANGQAVSMAGANGVYTFTPSASGNYYLAARNNVAPSGEPALRNYTLLVERGPDDYPANAAGAGVLTVGGSTKGRLETSTDKDWYGVALSAGTTYWFSAKPDTTGAYNSHAVQLKLYDAASVAVASATGYNSDTVLQFVPSKTGTYYFEVGDYGYYAGNYLASAAVGTPDDYGSDNAGASPLAVGGTVAGKLEIASDKDVFKIAVKAGTTYTFELKLQGTLGSPSMILAGADSSGSSTGLTSYTKPGVASYRVYTANYTGDYYLTVDNQNSSGTANYTLQVGTPAADDFSASAATKGLLAVGGKQSGELNYVGDVDWIKVKLVAGNKYAFVLDGKASGGGTLDLSTVDAALALVAPNNYSGYMSSMYGTSGKGYTFTADVTGDYHLAVSPGYYYNGSSASGSYTVSAYNLSGDSAMPGMLAFSPGAGSAGVSLTGNITLTFDDWIRIGDSGIRLVDSRGDVVETYSSSSSRVQINGKTVTIDPTLNLQPGTKYTLEMPAGSLLDYAGNKFLADRVYSFSTLYAVAQGGAGNDVLSGIGTNIRLSGGDGVDVVVYGSAYASYTVSRGASETKVAYRNGGSVAGDTLTEVERLQFSDKSIALDVAGHGGQTYRLYQAAFDRAPDKIGLGYWMSQLDNGYGLLAVAEAFLGSGEFAAKLGPDTSNTAFVASMYANVLHRAPDAGGLANWLAKLDAGQARAQVLVGFSESAENQAEILKIIGNGFEYTPYG